MIHSGYSIVYDQIIGMVGSTNLHIFGITCALAWQLPHESVFAEGEKSSEDHPLKQNRTTDRTDIPLKRTDNVTHSDIYYNRNNYHNHKMDDSYYDYLRTKLNKPPQLDRYYFGTNNQRWNYNHQIYPALRMRRSINAENEIHSEVEHFLEHHRRTRFDLYKSIEKYLNA